MYGKKLFRLDKFRLKESDDLEFDDNGALLELPELFEASEQRHWHHCHRCDAYTQAVGEYPCCPDCHWEDLERDREGTPECAA